MKGAAGHEVLLRFEEVSFSYGESTVLHDASFHIHRGEFAVLVGANGAGKTTILRLVLGLNRPSSGTVEVMGRRPEEARSSIGYLPQHASYDPAFPISVEQVVEMGLLRGMGRPSRAERAGRKASVGRALELADLADLGKRPYAALSGGQRRRVLLARALSADPEFLLLDEPAANLDADSEERLYAALARLKGSATILIVTHDTNYVSELTDVVLCVGSPGSHAGRSVVRHPVSERREAVPGLLGGMGRRVIHGTDLFDPGTCPDGCDRILGRLAAKR